MSDLAEKIVPTALDAEKSVLGCLLLDKDGIVKIADFLEGTDFYHDHHRFIYESMLQLFREARPIDLTTVATQLEAAKKLELIGGSEYLVDLQHFVPIPTHVFQYSQIVKHRSTLRHLIKAGHHITELGYDTEESIEKLLESAEKRLFSISQTFVKDHFVPIKDILTASYVRFSEIHDNPEAANANKITTQFTELDSLLNGGLNASDLVIIAARPSMGKTALALEIAQKTALNEGQPRAVGIVSLEMSKEQLVERIFCAQLQIDSWKIHQGKLEESDMTRMGPVMDELNKARIFIDDSMGRSIVELRSKIRRLQMEHGLDMLIVDYLQLMSSDNSYNRVQEISEISRTLKELARELHVPVIALSQLSRSVESRPDKRPVLSDLRDSGSIEQDADIVMMLYRPDYYEPELPEEEKNLLEVNVIKHRNGRTGLAKLNFNRSQMRFSDYAPSPSAFG